jgi:tRNA-specific 2-thiouridylase
MLSKNLDQLVKYTIQELTQRYPKGSKVAIGLSGGVDSAVSAWLLQQAGYQVQTVFLKCYPNTPGCKSEQDLHDAIKVASLLEIPLQTMDFIEAYRTLVLEEFYKEYEAGRTPNPDVLCNERIKFGLFFEKVLQQTHADYFATGHYARIEKDANGKYSLLRGIDESKDQSYFLYRVPPEVLQKTIFPIGGLTKSDVREVAHQVGLPVADKHDSTGICFIGPVDLVEFLSDRSTVEPGKVIDTQGTVIGTHRGVWFYTLGQRRGFETTVNKPLYVTGKNVARNEIIVGDEEDVYVHQITVDEITSYTDIAQLPSEVGVRIRNLGEIVPAHLVAKDSTVTLDLQKKLKAVAPGQSAVFYNGDTVLGGGVIFATKA